MAQAGKAPAGARPEPSEGALSAGRDGPTERGCPQEMTGPDESVAQNWKGPPSTRKQLCSFLEHRFARQCCAFLFSVDQLPPTGFGKIEDQSSAGTCT